MFPFGRVRTPGVSLRDLVRHKSRDIRSLFQVHLARVFQRRVLLPEERSILCGWTPSWGTAIVESNEVNVLALSVLGDLE